MEILKRIDFHILLNSLILKFLLGSDINLFRDAKYRFVELNSMKFLLFYVLKEICRIRK